MNRIQVKLAAAAVASAMVLAACSSGRTLDAADGAPLHAGSESTGGATPSPLVDPDRIVPGGPPRDGIPPIYDPKFLSGNDVDFLSPQEPVLAVTIHSQSKAYPIRIMMWHEIVDDTVGGVPVAVTYCPLCNTGIAYLRPMAHGKILTFGTSGMLYNSNLVMYDHQTDSLWPQAMGKAVVGPLTGTRLRFVPALIVSWKEWRADHPDGMVLSTDTGVSRPYGQNPYAYYDRSGHPFDFQGRTDPRLPATEYVLGVAEGGRFVAFPMSTLARRSQGGWTATTVTVGGAPVAVFWHEGTVAALHAARIPDSPDIGAAAAYISRVRGQALTFVAGADGIMDRQTGTRWTIEGRAVSGPLTGTQLRPARAVNSFWFDWAVFHPGTTIFGPSR